MIQACFNDENGDGSALGPERSGSIAKPGSKSISRLSSPLRWLSRMKSASLSKKLVDLTAMVLMPRFSSKTLNNALEC